MNWLKTHNQNRIARIFQVSESQAFTYCERDKEIKPYMVQNEREEVKKYVFKKQFT